MIYLVSQNGKVAYGVKEYIADSKNDIYELNAAELAPGSKVYITGTDETYILTPQRDWKEEKSVPSIIPTPVQGEAGEFLVVNDAGEYDTTANVISIDKQIFVETLEGWYSLAAGGGIPTPQKMVKYTGKRSTIVVPKRYNGSYVVELEPGIFKNNLNLNTLVLQNNINKIPSKMCEGCHGLTKVYILNSTMIKPASDAFLDAGDPWYAGGLTLYVPAHLVQAYEAEEAWANWYIQAYDEEDAALINRIDITQDSWNQELYSVRETIDTEVQQRTEADINLQTNINKIEGQKYNFNTLTDIAIPMGANENNYLELDMMLVENETQRWRCAHASIITWVAASVFDLKSNGNFTIPVTVNANADGTFNTILHLSQINIEGSDAFGGVGKIRVSTR